MGSYNKETENKLELLSLYRKLLNFYGKQNWWPVDIEYHKKHGTDPREEIVIGAVLTQNTSWKNVEKALENLKKHKKLSLKAVREMKEHELQELIKPAGFYRQKAKYLKEIAEFLNPIDKLRTVSREELLKVKGIGKETADAILLYAGNRLSFVIDAYTKRIMKRLYGIEGDYETLKELFERNIPEDLEIYKEFHALLDEHAKNFCKKKPLCENCFLKDICLYKIKNP